MVRLGHALDSWKSFREDTAIAAGEFPVHDLDSRATSGMAGFGETPRHILDASRSDTDTSTVAAELRSSLEKRRSNMFADSPLFFEVGITSFDGLRVTRLEMLQRMKEHEISHRAQLFVYLRLKGPVPATTRRRLAKAKA